jgi:hypothetical protein
MATERPDDLRDVSPADPEASLPPALRFAARRPDPGGSTLVLDAGGQKVVVVLSEDGGNPWLIWGFIKQQLTGKKTVRM